MNPDVVVLPAFSAADLDVADPPDELRRWLDTYDLARRDLPGATAYVGDGLAVVPTGVGKTAAATTVAAVCADPTLDLSGAAVLSVGVAGIAPRYGPVGSVVLAEAVVDWDPKYRWALAADPAAGVAPLEFQAPPVSRCDEALLERVADAAGDVDLRAPVDDRAEGEPAVRRGMSVCADEFWYGRELARQVDWLLDRYGLPAHACTQMEDHATAAALERFGVDRHLAVRAGANYDRPPAGESPASVADGLDQFAFEPAAENAFRVGRRAVAALR